MKITVKVKQVEISLDEDVNNTQIKYNIKEVLETIRIMSNECLKLFRETKTEEINGN